MAITLLVRRVIWLVFFTIVAEAQDEAKEWMYTRIFAASDKPVLRHAIESDKKALAALKFMVDYYKNMESIMTRAPETEEETEPLRIVNIPRFLSLYGFPPMVKVQRLFWPVKPSGGEEDAQYRQEKKDFARREKLVFKALGAIGEAVESSVAARDVKRMFPKWRHVFMASRRNYSTPDSSHRCLIRAQNSYRINGSFGVNTMVTDNRPAVTVRDRARHYLAEFLTVPESGGIGFHPIFFDVEHKPEYTRKYWGNRPTGIGDGYGRTSPIGIGRASSILSEWGGKTGIDFYGGRPVEDNLAVKAALSAFDATQQHLARETSLPSNTAILLFPLLMAVIPLALFADASSLVVLGYMIVTDFLSVLPLFIKGVEVLRVQNANYFATRTMVYGDLRARNTTVVAITWSCSCKRANDLTALGFSFVFLALLAMAGGVVLEVFVRAKVAQNKREAVDRRALLRGGDGYLWTRNVPCGECDCFMYAEESSSSGGLIGQWRKQREEAKRKSALPTLGVNLVQGR